MKEEILQLIEQHNNAVNTIIADHDLVGDDNWTERIEYLQHQLVNKVKALTSTEDFVPVNQCAIDFPSTTKQA